MRTDNERNGYDCIVEMLKAAEQEHSAIVTHLFSENPKNGRSFLGRLRNNLPDSGGSGDPGTAFRILVDTVSEYIHGYHAPASAKQLLYQALYALCESIGRRYQIPEYPMVLEDLPAPVTEDLTLALIKELHDRDGITKEEFGHRHQVDPRTVQNRIHALSGENRQHPLRIGGYAVQVPVKSFKKHNKRDEPRRYYTPDTSNPVFFQMNLIQTASLLQSFYYSNRMGNIIPLDMAIDTWNQLSDYARSRIREVFCKNDPDFADFLDEVEQLSSSVAFRFMSESELLAERDASASEQLIMAYKGSLICDMTLIGPPRSRKRQRIFYDPARQQYYAVSADQPDGERLYLREEELLCLTESP